MADDDIAALEQAAADGPKSVPAQLELAAAYVEAGRLQDAAGAFRAALELAPGDLEVLLDLAAVEHALGHDTAVEELIHQALGIDPDHPGIYRVIHQTSSREEQVIDRLVGAARYLELSEQPDDGEAVLDDLRETLTGAVERFAGTLVADEPARLAAAAQLGELVMVLPYLRSALPADEAEAAEASIRGLRARTEASLAATELDDDPVVAARQRHAEQEHLDAAIDELSELADMNRLDGDLTQLKAALLERRAEHEAVLERLGYGDETQPLFEQLELANVALAGGEPERALAGYQSLLETISGMGDDRTAPLAGPAALAYSGLAQAIAAASPSDPVARAEHLEIALEAANEAAEREPSMKQRYRAAILTELSQLRAAAEEPEAEEVDAAAAVAVEEPESEAEPMAEAEAVPEPEVVEEQEPESVVEAEVESVEEPEAEEVTEPEAVAVTEPAAQTTTEPEVAEPEPESVAEAEVEPVEEPSVAAVEEPVAEEAKEPAAPAQEADAAAELDLGTVFGEAQAAYDGRDFEAAESWFRKAIDLSDEPAIQALALSGVAASELALGRKGEAIETTEKAVRLDPRCVDAFLVRAEVAESNEDWPAALQAYQRGETADADDPRVQRGIGLTLCRLERWSDAAASLEKALAAEPDDAELCFRMGQAFRGLGQRDHALVCFEESLNLGLQPPSSFDAKAFIEDEKSRRERRTAAAAARAQARPAVEEVEEGDEEFDPDTAPPELKRPKAEVDLDVRSRVLKRAMADLDYDPERHQRCPVCRCPNSKDAVTCERCGHDLSFVEQRYATASGGRPCFIATAACGHADAPDVAALRRFRDRVLEPSRTGRLVMAAYDRLSPPLARFITPRERWRGAVRGLVVRPLATLARRALDDGKVE